MQRFMRSKTLDTASVPFMVEALLYYRSPYEYPGTDELTSTVLSYTHVNVAREFASQDI